MAKLTGILVLLALAAALVALSGPVLFMISLALTALIVWAIGAVINERWWPF